MKRLINYISAFLLLTPFVAVGQGQPTSTERLASSVERAVRDNLPGWQLVKRHVRDNLVLNSWKEKDREVSASFIEYESEAVAATKLEMAKVVIPVGLPKQIDGIGDEAYIWANYSGGRSTIQFRKGTVVVSVNAPADEAEKFAKHVADAIPLKK
jgi:hypothetical protein